MQNIEKIYEEYSNAVYKYLFCLTGKEDIAEELTQETFVIALKKINKFKGECKLSVWLCQIAKHLWYKKLKKDKIKSCSKATSTHYEVGTKVRKAIEDIGGTMPEDINDKSI